MLEIMTYPLKDLLSPNVLQPRIEVLYLLYQRLHLVFIRALNPASLTDGHVKSEPDGSVYGRTQPSAPAGNVLWGHTDAVLTTVGGAECEFALASTSLCNNSVIIVECLLNGHENTDILLGEVILGPIIPGFGMVMTCNN